MLHKIFTVFDAKAEAYLPPFFSPTVGLATRSFTDACNNPDHQFARYPADYTLFEIGTFDDNTGRITELPAFHPLGTALEYKHKTDSE